MGHSKYLGNTYHQHALAENLPDVLKDYPVNDEGFFGVKGRSRDGSVRNIVCDNPLEVARDLFYRLAKGGVVTPMSNAKGISSRLSDGATISFREVSSSDGSPAVEINLRKFVGETIIESQKIHIVKEKQK